MSAGIWKLIATLDDGSAYDELFGLKQVRGQWRYLVTRGMYPYAVGIWTLMFCLSATATPCGGWWMEIHSGGEEEAMVSPTELLITDPLGHRTGYDPSIRTVVRELPAGVGEYGAERLDDDVTGEIGPETKELSLSGPGDGIYWLTVTGVRRGRFWLELHVDDTSGKFAHREIRGEIDQGRVFRYRIEYSQDDAAKTLIVPDTYRFLGFLSPLDAEEPRSFKRGKTIPVTFRVRLKDGALAADVTARLEVRKDTTNVQEGKPPEAREPGRDKDGRIFRYNRRSDQHVCNLSTRQFSPGRWRLLAILDDGSTYDTTVDLK